MRLLLRLDIRIQSIEDLTYQYAIRSALDCAIYLNRELCQSCLHLHPTCHATYKREEQTIFEEHYCAL